MAVSATDARRRFPRTIHRKKIMAEETKSNQGGGAGAGLGAGAGVGAGAADAQSTLDSSNVRAKMRKFVYGQPREGFTVPIRLECKPTQKPFSSTVVIESPWSRQYNV